MKEIYVIKVVKLKLEFKGVDNFCCWNITFILIELFFLANEQIARSLFPFFSVFRIRIILMRIRIRIRGSASGMMDPDPDPT